MSPMVLTTNTYTIAIDNTSKSVTLSDPDADNPYLVLYNDSDKPVFVTSTIGAATAVYPTSGALPGKVIAAKATVTFTKPLAHKVISAIQAEAGTGSLYISTGSGE